MTTFQPTPAVESAINVICESDLVKRVLLKEVLECVYWQGQKDALAMLGEKFNKAFEGVSA